MTNEQQLRATLQSLLRDWLCHCDILYGFYCGHRERISQIMAVVDALVIEQHKQPVDFGQFKP